MKTQLYFAFVAALAANNPEGFTFDAETLKPVTAGYSVALEATQNSFGRDGLANVIMYAGDHPEVNAIGGWYDRESGRTYYDATVIVDNLKDAIELGRKNHQIAIFDLNNMKEIRL